MASPEEKDAGTFGTFGACDICGATRDRFYHIANVNICSDACLIARMKSGERLWWNKTKGRGHRAYCKEDGFVESIDTRTWVRMSINKVLELVYDFHGGTCVSFSTEASVRTIMCCDDSSEDDEPPGAILAIVGSRTMMKTDPVHWRVFCDEVDKYCADKRVTRIVSGGACGADTLAAYYARKHKIPFKVFPAKWSEHGRKAGPMRNTQIVNYCTHMIAFPAKRVRPDKPTGTEDAMNKALKAGKPCKKVDRGLWQKATVPKPSLQ